MSTIVSSREKHDYKPKVGLFNFYSERIKPRWIGALAIYTPSVAKLHPANDKMRDILPEPFDIFDHAGNMNVSMQLGIAGAFAGAKIAEKFDALPSIMKRAAVGMGSLAVLSANVISETRFGVSIAPDILVGRNTTPDKIDLAYGVAAGAFGVSMVDVIERQHNNW